jgi:hypothetical protein
MEYIVYLIFAVALRYAVFSHHTLETYRRRAVKELGRGLTPLTLFLSNKLEELYGCPFCNGCWAGLFVSIVCLPASHFIANVILFPLAAGYVSLLIEEKRKLDDEHYALIQQQREHLERETYVSLS